MSRLALTLLLIVSVIPPRASGQNFPYQTYEIGVGQTGGFGGLNLNTSSTQLAANEAQTADNIWYLRDGAIAMRPGFTRINATSLGNSAPWLLSRIYYKSGTPSFLIGHGAYIWKMSNGGVFANPDSILSYTQDSTQLGNNPNAGDPDTIRGGTSSWIGSVQAGDTILRNGARYEIKKVKSDSILLLADVVGASDNTRRVYQIPYIFRSQVFGSSAQVNQNIIVGNESHAALVFTPETPPVLLGKILEGRVDSTSVYGDSPCSGIIRNFWDGRASNVANEWAGYVVMIHGRINNEDVHGNRVVSALHRILSNTTNSYRLSGRLGTSGNTFPDDIGSNAALTTYAFLKYTIFAPLFTTIDTATVDSMLQATPNLLFTRDFTGGGGTDKLKSQSRMINFLTGKLAGQFFNITNILNYGSNRNSIEINDEGLKVNCAYDIKLMCERGDKFALVDVGVSGRHFLFQNSQLVMARSRLFPNEVRFSNAGTIHEFAPLNFRVVEEKTGTQITRVANFNGDLAIWQESDTWKIPGVDLSAGQLIHSLSGIGCPAPRSLVVSGNQATWLALVQGSPKVISWSGGTIGFNVIGQSSVFSGGGLQEVSAKIAPRLDRTSIDSIGRAAAGLWQDHYILSYPMDGKDTASASVAYHIPTGRWTTMDSGVALAASYFYNASSAPDSGQLYFAHPNRGIIYQFGNAVSDTNAYTRFATWISKDFHFQNYRELKQLMNFGLDYEKHASLTGGNYVIKAYKNLPGTQFKEGVAPYNPLTFTIGTDSIGAHSESRWINTGAFFRSIRFGLNIVFVGAGGAQNNDLKLNGFRFSIVNLGGL